MSTPSTHTSTYCHHLGSIAAVRTHSPHATASSFVPEEIEIIHPIGVKPLADSRLGSAPE
jgi:ribulose-5-phosphate 4-epimerase/fuculose-1-phosphate aldolase